MFWVLGKFKRTDGPRAVPVVHSPIYRDNPGRNGRTFDYNNIPLWRVPERSVPSVPVFAFQIC